jgi:hypothetical protein
MFHRRRQRILRRFILAIAVALIAIPTAQARLAIDDPISTGSSQRVLPDDRAVRVVPGVTNERIVVLPDDRAVRVVPGITNERFAVLPDDRAVRVTPTGRSPQTSPVVASSPSGIDWSDVGMGAGLAFAAMLAALGAVYAGRHVRPTAA